MAYCQSKFSRRGLIYDRSLSKGITLKNSKLSTLYEESFHPFWPISICAEVSEQIQRSTLGKHTEEMVAELNRKLRGWANYFCLGPVSKAYRAVDSHTRHRLRQWLCRKHKQAGSGTGAFPDEHLYEKLGLLRLEHLTAHLPWAKP